MRVCDLNTGMGRVAQAFSKLKEDWAMVGEHWHDDSSRQFEKTHLQPIPPKLQQLISSVQRLASVLEAAERECGDNPEDSQ